MNIIFVRHGECEYNTGITKEEDSNLTPKGEKQAEALGKGLKKYNISEIYTSNLKRAKKTGEIISNIIKVPVKESLEELREYTTKHVKYRLRAKFSRKLTKREKRLKQFLNKISKDKDKEKTILIVAHGVTNRILMAYLLGIKINKRILRFSQHNANINLLSWNENFKNWRIIRFNDINHLPIKLRDKLM